MGRGGVGEVEIEQKQEDSQGYIRKGQLELTPLFRIGSSSTWLSLRSWRVDNLV